MTTTTTQAPPAVPPSGKALNCRPQLLPHRSWFEISWIYTISHRINKAQGSKPLQKKNILEVQGGPWSSSSKGSPQQFHLDSWILRGPPGFSACAINRFVDVIFFRTHPKPPCDLMVPCFADGFSPATKLGSQTSCLRLKKISAHQIPPHPEAIPSTSAAAQPIPRRHRSSACNRGLCWTATWQCHQDHLASHLCWQEHKQMRYILRS